MKTQELFKNWGIAVTGGVATGKSFVSSSLREKGYLVYDADLLAKELCKKSGGAYEEALTLFGPDYLYDDKELNRMKIAETIFKDSKLRAEFESILHPKIHQRLHEKLKDDGLFDRPRLWFYEAALIFENKKEEMFKEVWVTICDRETQIKRLKRRGLEDKKFIESLLASQMDPFEKARKAHVLLKTETTKEDVKNLIDLRLQKLVLS